MRLIRISIGRLMLVVMGIALASAAMFRPTRLAAALTFSVVAFALIAGTLAAIYGRRASRPFFVGFALGGWVSMLAHFGFLFPGIQNQSYEFDDRPINLSITVLLDFAYPYLVKNNQDTLHKDGHDALHDAGFAPSPFPEVPLAPESVSDPASPVTPSVPGPTPILVNDTSPPKAAIGPALPIVEPPVIPQFYPTVASFTSPRDFWTRSEKQFVYLPLRSPSFLTIGYAIFSILFAFLTGYVAAWMNARSRSAEASSPV